MGLLSNKNLLTEKENIAKKTLNSAKSVAKKQIFKNTPQQKSNHRQPSFTAPKSALTEKHPVLGRNSSSQSAPRKPREQREK